MIFISGPMTSYPELNFPEFNRVAKLLRESGLRVFNPVDVVIDKTGLNEEQIYEKYMEEDLKGLAKCTHIFMLKGWQNSPGALREITRAIELGIKIILQE